MEIKQFNLFQIPYTGLEIGETYQLSSHVKEFGSEQELTTIDNVFVPSASTGILTVTIPVIEIKNDQLVVDSYLFHFEDYQWVKQSSMTQIIKVDNNVSMISGSSAMIGDGLIKNAVTICNRDYDETLHELKELHEQFEILNKTKAMYGDETKLVNDMSKKIKTLNKQRHQLSADYYQMRDQYDDTLKKLQTAKNEIKKLRKLLKEKK